jgi:hypothetical protein
MRMHSVQMTSQAEMLRALSEAAHAGRAATATGPAAAYEEFVAAVARRDAAAVLARMSEDYGRNLRLSRRSASFTMFFELWCENYPQHIEVCACFVDGDSAILETQAELDGAPVAGRVIMEYGGDAWHVSSERCADGRSRIPTGRSSRCQLA